MITTSCCCAHSLALTDAHIQERPCPSAQSAAPADIPLGPVTLVCATVRGGTDTLNGMIPISYKRLAAPHPPKYPCADCHPPHITARLGSIYSMGYSHPSSDVCAGRGPAPDSCRKSAPRMRSSPAPSHPHKPLVL
ncbi:hypothetical protein XELAEV_18013782mg [Xenopus laevis]|uniref:Uncharacterized protein n=1 Tax=Xenopus laevis TaxID=8355 RepID=A0A974DQ71_XENLA|nr:hypothetical protein XELAEV_18013782mg [Xenopus laevis]